MGVCVFKTSDIKPLLEDALTSPEHRKAWGSDYDGAAMWFVHDQGVYCMSNGLRGDEKPLVTYAANCNPDKDEDWWDNSRHLVGADDFVEAFELEDPDEWLGFCDKFKEMRVRVTSKSMAISFTKPKGGKR